MITTEFAVEAAAAGAKVFVLVIHTILSNGNATTIHLSPYTEEGCTEAQRHYEAGVGLTLHALREGEEDMVLRAITICMPGPDAGRQLPPVITPKRRSR